MEIQKREAVLYLNLFPIGYQFAFKEKKVFFFGARRLGWATTQLFHRIIVGRSGN
jgi:hypothetical protein